MKRWQAILATVGLWAAPVANIWMEFIPPEALKYVLALLATINLFVVKKASETNPNGTPAQVAWNPKQKQRNEHGKQTV